MKNALITLITSKRTLVAVLVAAVDVLVLFGLDIDPAAAEKIATLVTTVGVVLIAGISVSDAGKALSLPPGVGHRDDA